MIHILDFDARAVWVEFAIDPQMHNITFIVAKKHGHNGHHFCVNPFGKNVQ